MLDLLNAIREFGQYAELAELSLVTICMDSQSKRDIREIAIIALGEVGCGKSGIDCLLDVAVNDENPVSRRLACKALLGNIDCSETIWYDKLQQCLKDEEPRVRAAAGKVLGTCGGDVNRILPQLMVLLSDDNQNVSISAATGIGIYGERNDTLIDELNEYYHDPEIGEGFKLALAFALERTKVRGSGEGTLGLLLSEAVDNDDELIRSYCVEVLKYFSDNLDVVNTLIVTLDDPSFIVRVRACKSLAELGQNARSAIPKLAELSVDANSPRFPDSILGFMDYGRAAKKAIEAIER